VISSSCSTHSRAEQDTQVGQQESNVKHRGIPTTTHSLEYDISLCILIFELLRATNAYFIWMTFTYTKDKNKTIYDTLKASARLTLLCDLNH